MESDKITAIIKYVEGHAKTVQYDTSIFDIREGDLVSYLEDALGRQLSGNSLKVAMERAAPINILNKIVSKLSKLYASPPKRRVLVGTSNDEKLIEYYENEIGINIVFNDHNENYNTYKKSAIEIYEDTDKRMVGVRAMPGQQFIAYSDNKINPLTMTDFVKFMGEYIDPYGVKKQKYWAYNDREFISFNSKGEIISSDMEANDGTNSFGIIPFVYTRKYRYLLVPKCDSDLLRMTLLVPVLLTDMNFASMFLSMPILYGIDCDTQNVHLSPNNLWNIKSNDPEKKPEVGVLRAEPDLEAQMNNIVNQLSLWLESKNIKPGTVGKLGAENFSSGISKLISEMDTLEDRKMQESVFRDAEKEFWYRLAIIHNTLARAGRIENRMLFSDPEKLEIQVKYQEEKILETRADKVDRLKNENEARFTSRKRAILELNDDMSEEEADKIMDEIDEESKTDAPEKVDEEIQKTKDEMEVDAKEAV